MSYRPSLIPMHGLELPITLTVRKNTADNEVFRKMIGFLEENYIEPDKIVAPALTDLALNEDDGEDLEEFIPENDDTNEINDMNENNENNPPNLIVIDDEDDN